MKMRMFLLVLLLFLAPVWADIPVPPEEERRWMQQELDEQTKGLSPSQQYAKVQQLLADMPQKIADQEKKVQAAEEAERAGKRAEMPSYMMRKQITYLGKQETFLREWLNTHPAPAPEAATPTASPQSLTAPPSPPPASAGPPVTPPMLVGLTFLVLAVLLAGRRALRSPA